MNPLLRFARWFYPGLGVKRWLVLAAFGAALLVNGSSRWFTAEGSSLPINEAIDEGFAAISVPLGSLSYAFMIVGVVLIVFGIRQWLRSIVLAIDPRANKNIVDALFDRLVAIPGALSVAHVSGDNDFHVHVAVATPERLRDLILEHITSHPAVTKTQTQLIFEARQGAGVLGPA